MGSMRGFGGELGLISWQFESSRPARRIAAAIANLKLSLELL